MIVFSTFTIEALYMYNVVFCYFFLITQCKDRSRGTPNKSLILRSPSVHISFCVHSALRLRSALAHRSPFISAYQIPFSVRSPFTNHSSGKVERFRRAILWFVLFLYEQIVVYVNYNVSHMSGELYPCNKNLLYQWTMRYQIIPTRTIFDTAPRFNVSVI